MRTTVLRLLLPSLLSAVSYAAPIQLQATFVEASLCGFTVQGANFSFKDSLNGPCQDTSVGAEPPFNYFAQAQIFAPAYGQYVGYPAMEVALGTITLPENPGRAAVLTGSVFGTVLSIPIPLDPLPGVVSPEPTLDLSENTFLIGSLAACLLPSGDFGGPCDPAYVNFATVNIDVAGSYAVGVGYFGGGSYVGTFDRGFTGTLAAVPEPSTLPLLFIGSVSATFLGWRRLVRW